MDIEVSTVELILRLVLSIVFGGIIGWEREVSKKAAGLRTNMMVSLGAATFTLVMVEMYNAVIAQSDVRSSDPTRIVEGIAGGIGFLGAGTIIQSRGTVEGITTAATIWVVGAIGIACGGGHYMIAGVTVSIAFFVLTVLGYLERALSTRTKSKEPTGR